MKCPSCGAEIGNDKFCQYCGSQVTMEMKKEQEYVNKDGCPKCGSSNVSFSREKQGEVLGSAGSAVVHATVGVCHDCGYTWSTAGQAFNTNNEAKVNNTVLNQQPAKKKRTWLWVLGWIFIFPLPLTLILLKKDIKPAIKYGIIAIAWIVYLVIGFVGGGTEDNSEIPDSTTNISIVYEDNESINLFLNNYNEANPDDIITPDEIEKDYHHGKEHDNQINVLKDANVELNIQEMGSKVRVFIKGDNLSIDDYKALVLKCVKGFDPSLTDEKIESYWKQTLDDSINTMEFDEVEIYVNMYNDAISYLTIDGEVK